MSKEGKRRHPGKPKHRLSELRCFLLATIVLLGGLSVLHSLSSAQLTLTSETDYRRLSFFATVRQRQEDTDVVPPAYIRPGTLWLDTGGTPIQAHGGGVLEHAGRYYWYGEDKSGETFKSWTLMGQGAARVDVIGIRCYSSDDLANWKDEGLALAAGQHPDLARNMVVERPKVIYNDLTQQFVMWMHIDDARYDMARAGVAIGDSPIGPFRYLRSFRPHGEQSRDLTLYKDEDRSAYVVYSSDGNKDLHIGRLSRDYTDVIGAYKTAIAGASREAPALFRHGKRYYMVTSGCTGWDPNKALVHSAQSLMGEWTLLGNPCIGESEMEAAQTFGAQSTFVLPAPGRPGSFIFMADQWNPENLSASRYVWLPLWVLDRSEYGTDPIISTPPGSMTNLQVTVTWQQLWRVSDLNTLPKTLKPMRNVPINASE